MLQLTFNPGLTLTGFRTTRPWVLVLEAGDCLGRSHIKSTGCSSEILKRTLYYLLSCIIFSFNTIKRYHKNSDCGRLRLKTLESPSAWLNAGVEGGEGVGGVLSEKLGGGVWPTF